MEIFFEIHDGLEREGPGSDATTRKAFNLLPHVNERASLLDVGCGPGSQTLELSRLVKQYNGQITAVDYYEKYLSQLRERISSQDIITLRADMNTLPFEAGAFDIIWSEGAIYIMGFERGLKNWKKFLKPGGYIAVSEISWLTESRPQEIAKFWDAAYPAMQTVGENIKSIEKEGYVPIDHFTLPKRDWFDQYYAPIESKLKLLRIKYKHDPETLEILDQEQQEIDLFRKYGDYYGYEFYLMQKPNL